MRTPYRKTAMSVAVAKEIQWGKMSLQSQKCFFVVLGQIYYGIPKTKKRSVSKFKVAIERSYLQKCLGTNIGKHNEKRKLAEKFTKMNKEAFVNERDYLFFVSEFTDTEVIITINRPEEVVRLGEDGKRYIEFDYQSIMNCKTKRMLPALVYLAVNQPPAGTVANWTFFVAELKKMFGYEKTTDYVKYPDEFDSYRDFYNDFGRWADYRSNSNDYSSKLIEVAERYGFNSLSEAEREYSIIKQSCRFLSSDFEKIVKEGLMAINETVMMKVILQENETNGNQYKSARKEQLPFKRNKGNDFIFVDGRNIRLIESYSIMFERLPF